MHCIWRAARRIGDKPCRYVVLRRGIHASTYRCTPGGKHRSDVDDGAVARCAAVCDAVLGSPRPKELPIPTECLIHQCLPGLRVTYEDA